MGKNKALAHHTSTYFHTCIIIFHLIQFNCWRCGTLSLLQFVIIAVLLDMLSGIACGFIINSVPGTHDWMLITVFL